MANLDNVNKIKYYGKITAIILIGYLTFSLFRITNLYNDQLLENVVHNIKGQLSINAKTN